MGANNLVILSGMAVLLTACEFKDGRNVQDTVFTGTLAESCGEDCLFWSETDQSRGAIGRDGLRVYIEPSFGQFDFRFEIVPQPRGCVTIWPDEDISEDKDYCAHYLVRMRKQLSQGRQSGVAAQFEDFNFVLPQEGARELLGVADKLSDAWVGSPSGTIDGTTIAYELTKRGKTRSMISNDSLDTDHRNPAAWIGAELHRFALAYGPTGQIPRLYDWHSYDNEDGRFPCNNPGFNVPDPDGFGTGDDACARSLTDEPSR
ncbi:hypothetical protein [Blastomonas aquatica]|uniref:Uncharacterized protein n=1 Tax=Blastomonas aquatica TaxID=1510276 RepID=A0ABQ1J8E7_9SPHN|nr:hypothetical protein [Blastomonas aquatica]GGB60299.1 hypothetical protein GCM10010833_13960 [Blastomonas aquatica]